MAIGIAVYREQRTKVRGRMTEDRSIKEVGRGNAEGGKWFQISLPGSQPSSFPASRPYRRQTTEYRRLKSEI
jgi:hypothetical protein